MGKVRARNNFTVLPKSRAHVPGYSSWEYPGKEVLAQSYNGLKMSSLRSKGGQKLCQNQSKSIQFVTSRAVQVGGMKKWIDNNSSIIH